MWKNNKTYKLSYLGWSCILHITAMFLIILNPRVDDLDTNKVEITFQVAGEGINSGSKQGDSLEAKKAKSASTKNDLNDSLLSELEKQVSKGASEYKEEKTLAAKATNTEAESPISPSLESELDSKEAPVAQAPVEQPVVKAQPLADVQAQADFANTTKAAPETAQAEESSLEEELSNTESPTEDNNLATDNTEPSTDNNKVATEESGLRNLVKKSPVSVPRQQVLGKRSFKSNRISALGKARSSTKRKSALGKARASVKRENTLGKARTTSKRKSAFGKRSNTKSRSSALGNKRSTSKRGSVFAKRSGKSRKSSALGQARGANSNSTRSSGALGQRNQSGTRTGSLFGRGKNGNSNKVRKASALGSRKGQGKRSYGNAFGRGGAGSGKTFGLPKGIRDARSLKQIAGNPVPNYPYSARVRKNQGVVFLVYYVDHFGKVSRVKIHRSSGFSNLDNSALKAIARYRYYKGQSGYVIHPVQFTLTGTAKVSTGTNKRI